MSSMILSGDTSGSVTVTVPAVAGTNTITLPAATGTVMVSGNMPAFSAYLASNQSVSSGTEVKVNLDTEVFDTNNNFASGRFTPTVAGYYQINATVGFNGTAIVAIVAIIKKNGTTVRSNVLQATISPTSSAVVSDVIYCNGSTDYIEMYGLVVATSPNFAGTQAYTGMSGSLVRSA